MIGESFYCETSGIFFGDVTFLINFNVVNGTGTMLLNGTGSGGFSSTSSNIIPCTTP